MDREETWRVTNSVDGLLEIRVCVCVFVLGYDEGGCVCEPPTVCIKKTVAMDCGGASWYV